MRPRGRPRTSAEKATFAVIGIVIAAAALVQDRLLNEQGESSSTSETSPTTAPTPAPPIALTGPFQAASFGDGVQVSGEPGATMAVSTPADDYDSLRGVELPGTTMCNGSLTVTVRMSDARSGLDVSRRHELRVDLEGRNAVVALDGEPFLGRAFALQDECGTPLFRAWGTRVEFSNLKVEPR